MKFKRILLIDDDPDDAGFFKDAVIELDKDIIVEYAAAGDQAIQLLLKSVRPDIIFMDVNMPIKNGWETLRELKLLVEHYALPIVMFSTMSFEHVDFTPSDLGAAAFMTKPDSLEGLKNGLSQLFARL
jgi:CheY-like chemotaxis protein